MKFIRMMFFAACLGYLMIGMITPAVAKNKYEEEIEKEQGAIKLVREVQRGGRFPGLESRVRWRTSR